MALATTGIASMALCYTRLLYFAHHCKSITIKNNRGKFDLYINDQLAGQNLSEIELDNFIIDFK